MLVRVLVFSAVMALMACASGSGGGQPRGSRNVITQEEIVALPITTASDLVNRLRPSWLRGRGPTSISGGIPALPLVYVDEVRTGGIEALDLISSQVIREIRFINGRDATTKWGLDHGGGVIMVLTGR